MVIVVFTYEREQMLKRLLFELKGYYVVCIDDGSEWVKRDPIELLRTPHEGKIGFWKKWVMAQQIALGIDEDYFLFLPDDITDINLEWLESIKRQGWKESLFAINVINDGRLTCWGHHRTGQEAIKVGDIELNEVGFVDCGFFTNRLTLESIEIKQVPLEWFADKERSSGVGHQLTTSFRKLGVKMMMPTPSLCKHGTHESKMHPELRKKQPLIT